MTNEVRNFLVFAILFTLVIFISASQFFNKYELLFYDLRLQFRPQQPTSDQIVLIEIDDQTLQLLKQWPIPRDFHASLIDVLTELGAKTIIFDIIFPEPTSYDEIFAESIKKAGNVYLPQAFDLEGNTLSKQLRLQPTSLIAPITETLKRSNPQVGHINVKVDIDGKIRRTILFIRDQDKLIPQLGLNAACNFLKLNCSNAEFKKDKVIIDERLVIPVLHGNEILVNYPGTWEKSFQHFSYIEILKNYQEWKENKRDIEFLSRFKDKVCFIGLTATGTVDLRSMPLENNYPMLGLHASVFNSVIQNKFIQKVSYFINLVIGLFVFFLSLRIGLKFDPLFSFLGSVILGLLYFVITIIGLNVYGIWLDLFFPLCIITLTYLGCTSVRWFNEIQKRQVLEKEMVIAQKIQQQFLAGKDQGLPSVTVGIWFQPAKFVAGDLYEVFKVDANKTGILLGDVSGKGLSAALLMAQAISLFRVFSRLKSNPQDVLDCLSKELCGQFLGRFVTAAYCIADKEKQQVTIASAGQGPLFIYRHLDQNVEELPIPGSIPLGIMKDSVYESMEFKMKEEDMLILASDGVFDTKDEKGKEWGIENFKKVIGENTGKTPLEVLESIKNSVMKFSAKGSQFDDITFVIFSFKQTKN